MFILDYIKELYYDEVYVSLYDIKKLNLYVTT